MEDIIKDLLTSPFASFGFVMGLVFGAIYLTKYVTEYVTKISASHSTLSKSVEKLENNIDEIRRDISYMKGMINLNNDLVQSHSPMSLTEKGKELSTELGIETIVSENWKRISSELTLKTSDMNAYDIQQYCIETCAIEPDKFFDDDAVNRLKDFAYKQGMRYQQISMVVAIIIRDRYLKENGINR